MKVVFWLVLALSLTMVAVAESRAQNNPPAKGQNAPVQGEEPDVIASLAQRNGIEMRIVETHAASDKKLASADLVPSFVGGQKELARVAAHPENATAIQLAVAASMSCRAGNLQDAAFLQYAARLRISQDLDKYPPLEAQASGTNVFLSMLLGSVKIDLLRELCVKPKILADVVKRIEALDLQEPAGYNPGWEHTSRQVPAGLFAKNKAALLETIKPTSELLLLPEYFQAFFVFCTSNQLPEAEQKSPAVVERCTKAVDAMKRIEKEKNVHGLMFQIDKPLSD